MELALHHHRRSRLSVQDLLCQNSSETSSCPSPTPATSPPSSPAFSSPLLSHPHCRKPPTPIPSSIPSVSDSLSDHDPACVPHHSVAHLTSDPSADPAASHILTAEPHILDNRQKSVRGPWRIEEDRLLIDLVRRYGPKHWSSIATYFPRRSGKQARERWMNQLNPNLKKKNWTADEDRTILRAHISLGNKWSAIAQMLPGRTDNSVKNRYNSTLKRAMKERGLTAPNFDINDFVENLHARHYLVTQPFHDAVVSSHPMEHVLPTKVCGGASTFSSSSVELPHRYSLDHLQPLRMEITAAPQPPLTQQHPSADGHPLTWGRRDTEHAPVSSLPHMSEAMTTGRSTGISALNSGQSQPQLLPAFNQVLATSAALPSKQMDTHIPDYRETSPCTFTHPAIPRHTLIDSATARFEESAMALGHHNSGIYKPGNGGPTRGVLSASKVIAKRRHTRS